MVRLTNGSIVCLLATVLVLLNDASSNSDDFGFDVSEDLELEISDKDVPDEQRLLPPRKYKGIPDVTAVVGKLLKFTVPADAFTGNVQRLELNSPLPSWLSYDISTRTFIGVPLSSDKSDVLISMVGHGGGVVAEQSAFDVFRIHVQQYPGKAQYISEIPCSKNPLVLTIFIDKKLNAVKPQQRNNAMHNLAGFLGIHISAFTLEAQKPYTEKSPKSVVIAGPGNVRKPSSKQTSGIDLLVGCEDKLWPKYLSLLEQLKEQARDGTLSEVIGLPVLAWRVHIESGNLERGRRDTPAANEDDYEDYYDYEYDGDEDDKDYGDVTTLPPLHHDHDDDHHTTEAVEEEVNEVSSTLSTTSTTTTTESSEIETHHHRHHHGEIPVIVTHEEESPPIIETSSTIVPHVYSVQVNESTTVKPESDYYTSYDDDEDDEDYDESETEVPVLVPVTNPPVSSTYEYSASVEVIETTSEKLTSPSLVHTTEVLETVKEEEEETSPVITSIEPVVTTTVVVTTPTTSTTTTTTTTTTTPSPPTSLPSSTTELIITTTQVTEAEEETEMSSTVTTPSSTTTTTEKLTSATSSMSTSSRTTEFIGPKNNPPIISQRLKRIRITAGTVLSYFIPEDTFTDLEDGTNLSLKFLDSGAPVKKNFWIQFNERTREIYGLPLETHVSKWEFVIQATDKEGATISDKLEVIVQQHKGRRTVTHEFLLRLHVEKKHEFPTAVDWQLRTLRGIASLFHNKDLTQIVVRDIDFSTDLVTFTWTNDTLPRSYCPKTELDYLYHVMVVNVEGDPSFALMQVLSPELRVKNVEFHGLGQCEQKPELPVPPPKPSPTNFSPIPRNQVDLINATVGELLIFRVPDDTFYDPEDGNARNLKMSLLTIDHQPLSPDHWLQFDVKNQEFFGVPLASDLGRSEYQLVCEDRGGLTANDGLVVVVRSPPEIRYNVEFSMTLVTQYDTFINSASLKRKFMEKLKELFRDKDTSNLRILNIMEGSTVVSWCNKSLAIDRCPDMEIKRLRQVLINDDETLADRVEVIMGPEFPIIAITLTPTGVCQGELTVVHSPDNVIPLDESTASETSDDYFITFVIPAVIIAVMLMLAGIVACVLYRRRRTGKMNVEDDERLNNFRSKGIPVIFQDEIDEKPESGTKAPVILKEEKPPLVPPEYSKSGTPIQQYEETNDAPYQPPPPFTSSQDNGRQPRPKPTPTYRKPPPYVPP